MRSILKSIHWKSKFSHHGGGTRLHRQQRTPTSRSFSGHCRKYFRYHPQNMRRCAMQARAIRVLPRTMSICTNRDIFITGNTEPDIRPGRTRLSLTQFLNARCSERPYLHHACYLFLTKTTKEALGSKATGPLCVVFLVRGDKGQRKQWSVS